MTLVLAQQQDYTTSESSMTTKRSWHLQQLFNNWIKSQSNLRYYWYKNRMLSSGYRVPYRVWMRHGAYLEMQRNSRNYD